VWNQNRVCGVTGLDSDELKSEASLREAGGGPGANLHQHF